MRDIKQLSDHIKDEIEDAQEYIRQAIDLKEKDKELADLYCTLSGEELKHMDMLHDMVVKKIDEWKKSTGQQPPPDMQARYEILHEIHIGDANKARLMIQLYKGVR